MDPIRPGTVWSFSICLVIMAAFSQPSFAQEEAREPRHKLALFTGSSWLPQGRNAETDQPQFVVAPVYGLDYEFRIGQKWAIGTYNDITLVRVAIEEEDGTFLERENAVLLSLGASYEPFPRFAVEISAGVETDANETLRAGRFGAKYTVPLPQEWELGITASYVNKQVFDALSIGLSVGKRL